MCICWHRVLTCRMGSVCRVAVCVICVCGVAECVLCECRVQEYACVSAGTACQNVELWCKIYFAGQNA